MNIRAWLADLGLEWLAAAFAENGIDASVLPDLTNEDLKELGLERLGDRKRLLAEIARLGTQEDTLGQHDSAEGERRQVTVLFADIAGFTSMSERLGAEATHALLNRYFTSADRIIQDFGGAIDKHIGDNVMAVFGAPVAHDNDPERAVRAALAIHAAANDIEGPEGPLRLHIGIASGQVVASGTGSESHREYTVTGETVNLAARLERLAMAGQTLVSDFVRRDVAGLFAMTALGLQSLKGISRPVPVWRVDAAQESTRFGSRTPFVGRRSELGQCRVILDEVAATGHGQAILLRGAAGIGKTRLAEEVLNLAGEAGFAAHRCLVLDFGSRRGEDTVAMLVCSLLGMPSTSRRNERLAAVDDLLAAGGCGASERVFLYDLLDLPQTEADQALYDAMDDASRRNGRRDLVAGLAVWSSHVQPQLILIEDVHWADSQTLDILAAVIAGTGEHPIVVLATARPEGDPLDGAWRNVSLDQPISIINIGPLRASEARELALGFARANRDRFAECLDRAAGNPLFLEQLLQNAVESTDAAVPGSIHSIVLARVDRLAPIDKRALQIASVFGQRFGLRGLRQLLGVPGYDCANLLQHRLVRPDGEDFLFAHALVRDCVYDSILTSTRRQYHLEAAAGFEGNDLTLTAEHLDLADDPRAARAYLDAAQAELAQYRHEQAIVLLKKGTALASDVADRVDLALALGESQDSVGSPEEAITAFGAALDAASDPLARCRAWIGLAGAKRITDDLDGALADLDSAERAARREGLKTEQARVHFLRGNLLFPRGDIKGCMREHGIALALAREAGSDKIVAEALGGLADAEYMRGRYCTAAKRFEECVELSRAHGLGRTEVANLPMLAITTMWMGDLRRTSRIVAEALEAARRVGHRRAEMIAHHGGYFCFRMRGEFEKAAMHVADALAIARDLGARRFEAEALHFGAELDYVRGDRQRALENIRTAVEAAREGGMSYLGPAVLGGLFLITEDAAEREAARAEAEALLDAGSISHNHILFRTCAIEGCLRDNDYLEAERHADALAAHVAEPGLRLIVFLARRGHLLARAYRGESTPELAREIDSLLADGEEMEYVEVLGEIRRVKAEISK